MLDYVISYHLLPVSMGSAESHQVDSVPTEGYDGSASKPSASLGARHTVDKPSNPLFNPAVMADSSR